MSAFQLFMYSDSAVYVGGIDTVYIEAEVGKDALLIGE